MAVGGLLSLPSWANGWNQSSLQSGQSLLAPHQDALLAEIVETIIPTTDTPGAKALGIHSFIQKIVTDCMEPSAQETMTKGLTAVQAIAQKKYNKSFISLDPTQRTELLKAMSQATEPDQKAFFSLVKGMTIQGYMSSEYVMNNITHYEMAPGRYHGCVPVVAKNNTSKNQQK